MGTNTDPYQPVEGRYRLTGGIVRALAEARNPFSITTKSTLVERDLDLLRHASERADVRVHVSVGCLDDDLWRAVEPHTPRPRRRLETVARLRDAGIDCGVLVAPVIPGLSDSREHLRAVVRGAVDAGASSVDPILLNLPAGMREHFLGWLSERRPDLVREYRRRYRGRHAPERERAALAATVRELVREAGGVRAPRRAGRPRGAPDRQLRLA